ncbi:MAG: phage tail protein [Bacteroidota bacterium]
MDEYLGMIKIFGGSYAPQNWALCNGQLLPIRQYTALFSILGVQYGGDGVTTFALPNLQAQAPLGFGQGPGLSYYALGQTGGTPGVALTQLEIPAHNHSFNVSTSNADTVVPVAMNSIGSPCRGSGRSVTKLKGFINGGTPNQQVMQGSTTITGANQIHMNLQPYLGMNYIICTSGIFPPRS